jgi:cytidylate kinase
MHKSQVIAIDGPAASGKSTVAAAVAKQMGIPYVNTGNMYRAVTLAAIEKGYENAEKSARVRILENILKKIDLRYVKSGDSMQLRLDGKNAGEALRAPIVAKLVSDVAASPAVRQWLVERQRKFTELGLIVMEGRDIGTVVFPDAAFKFFLTASPEIRAKRRLAQSDETLEGSTVESVAAEIAKRDEMDMTRKVAPLRKADEAITIDSSELTLEQVVSRIISYVEEANG